ncbi:hypothetical protein KI809_01865 [Geobacter pelophilus]|uniref:Lipoprotein n=1 Tax=Geoanaerobacter pelophilus TaxID=60036 RepID=A0AAW4KWQ0_9BACT|nr:hypothetical protein [Geoanaerobacter pelophilus]MBT0663033.1 hypothetical protein [Geoanaerobacter pelophilus]
MKKHLITIAAALTVGLVAGCGGGGSTPATSTSVSGAVADGYLVGATVFLDKNSNYQLDAGEPSATTDANGAYTLNIDPADVGKYPIVAMAIKGQTIDKDTNQTVSNSYILSMPATAMSGTVSSNFISPMSTLIREKMEANPGMTLNDAMIQLRNQMNLPSTMNMMADYVAGSQSGTNATQFQTMHTTAQQMVGLMAGQASLVMNGSAVNQSRYRSMMGTINSNMPAITANVINGMNMNSTLMIGMISQMQTQLGGMPVGGGFGNYSGMFRNMTSHSSFWSNTGTPMTPMSGGMMR